MNLIRSLLIICLLASQLGCSDQSDDSERLVLQDNPQVIAVPASDFLHELPKGDEIASARSLDADWIFNNTAIVLNSRSNLMTTITLANSGTYNLFVRSVGRPLGSFKVAINEQLTDQVFGEDSVSEWNWGGPVELNSGENILKITRINTGAAFDVIALSNDPSISQEDIKNHQLNEDVSLVREYEIPPASAVKFGDVNGDELTDFLVLERDYTAHVFDNAGKRLWSWDAPESYRRERSGFEAPGVLWDFDQDNRSEVVHWRMIGEEEYLVIADGTTGEVIRLVSWPTRPHPHEYNNFRLAIGKLTEGDPNEIITFTDMDGTIRVDAYSSDLEHLWNHTETRKKDNLGHYVYPVDIDKDGIDEVLVSALLLDHQGKEIWNRFDLFDDNHDHADNYKFADINKDNRTDLITANSETGVFMFDGMTGDIHWQNVAEHTQQIEVGNFLKDYPGPQIVAGARTYGNRRAGEPYLWSQLYWYSSDGELLFKWPWKPLNCNPDFVKGDWMGNGTDQLFWFKFLINGSGAGDLYFPDPVYHMFDFTGNGAEEVITLSYGRLGIYGYIDPKSGMDKKADLNYLKHKVVNHTHY